MIDKRKVDNNMDIVDKFYSLLYAAKSLNRLVAPPLAVAILYYLHIEQSAIILAIVFVIMVIFPDLLISTLVFFGMKIFGIVKWEWVEIFVPGSGLLLLPFVGLLVWLALGTKASMHDQKRATEPPKKLRTVNLTTYDDKNNPKR